jgi:hypothetical protein
VDRAESAKGTATETATQTPVDEEKPQNTKPKKKRTHSDKLG